MDDHEFNIDDELELQDNMMEEMEDFEIPPDFDIDEEETAGAVAVAQHTTQQPQSIPSAPMLLDTAKLVPRPISSLDNDLDFQLNYSEFKIKYVYLNHHCIRLLYN